MIYVKTFNPEKPLGGEELHYNSSVIGITGV